MGKFVGLGDVTSRNEQQAIFEVNGVQRMVYVKGNSPLQSAAAAPAPGAAAPAAAGGAKADSSNPNHYGASMPGKVLEVFVAEGEAVASGQSLVKVEAMKMETEIKATGAGTVVRVAVSGGQTVAAGDLLVELAA